MLILAVAQMSGVAVVPPTIDRRAPFAGLAGMAPLLPTFAGGLMPDGPGRRDDKSLKLMWLQLPGTVDAVGMRLQLMDRHR